MMLLTSGVTSFSKSVSPNSSAVFVNGNRASAPAEVGLCASAHRTAVRNRPVGASRISIACVSGSSRGPCGLETTSYSRASPPRTAMVSVRLWSGSHPSGVRTRSPSTSSM